MASDETDDRTIYAVVVNHEEQYSIWPAERERPPGWSDAGRTGTRGECLEHIREVWTDMRPLSLRRKMQEAAEPAASAPSPPASGDLAPTAGTPPEAGPDDLVRRLSAGEHRVAASVRPPGSAGALREAIARRYVLVKFVDTAGGTELGVRLDEDGASAAARQADGGAATIRIEGRLKLDGVPVRCVADLDAGSLEGRGHLEPLSDPDRDAAGSR